ncbi:hypothetical protein ARMGADRAFT_1035061 [Armillaria gallica]|uniref:Uncharacterized protein n=1 Tax=Armillaria gallica TaxID=47427 RepID=A0A2H3CVY2_ARMGA|nr:hypothetical protein ARMGADRAFT_1035061 [Armillaria gallica]
MSSASFINEIKLTQSEAVRNKAPSKLVVPYGSWVKPKKCGNFGSRTMAIAFTRGWLPQPVYWRDPWTRIGSCLGGLEETNARTYQAIHVFEMSDLIGLEMQPMGVASTSLNNLVHRMGEKSPRSCELAENDRDIYRHCMKRRWAGHALRTGWWTWNATEGHEWALSSEACLPWKSDDYKMSLCRGHEWPRIATSDQSWSPKATGCHGIPLMTTGHHGKSNLSGAYNADTGNDEGLSRCETTWRTTSWKTFFGATDAGIEVINTSDWLRKLPRICPRPLLKFNYIVREGSREISVDVRGTRMDMRERLLLSERNGMDGRGLRCMAAKEGKDEAFGNDF